MNIIQSNDKTILVVDDDPAICEMMTTVLSRQNFQVVSTVHSKEALTYLRPGAYLKIDLLITDLQMPAYGGFSIIRDIQSGDYESVPILVVTGRNLDDQAIRMIMLENGVRGVFKKPLRVTDFIAKVHEILETAPPPPPAET